MYIIFHIRQEFLFFYPFVPRTPQSFKSFLANRTVTSIDNPQDERFQTFFLRSPQSIPFPMLAGDLVLSAVPIYHQGGRLSGILCLSWHVSSAFPETVLFFWHFKRTKNEIYIHHPSSVVLRFVSGRISLPSFSFWKIGIS